MDRKYYKKHMPNMPLSIDNLVNSNGNWTVTYCYNRFGDNVLFLLPNYQIDDDEQAINRSVIECPSGPEEVNQLITQFTNTHRDTPFIVCHNSHRCAVDEINRRLCNYEIFDRFVDDAEVFWQWCKTIHILSHLKLNQRGFDEDELIRCASVQGWGTVYYLMSIGMIEYEY